ncbi:unnamed protein product [Clonostachys rosea f. rosea IK726]|uniref:Transcription factor domain-containing protein n=2 Tax=Bionectria ochroleuca TaxID=29856 RepID=A0A0B7K4D1_BIOOC|nr:unnamed protein product [Clonostachys rosea f. rosea IK726]
MTVAQGTREFKFVGAYSRKRRRMNQPGLDTKTSSSENQKLPQNEPPEAVTSASPGRKGSHDTATKSQPNKGPSPPKTSPPVDVQSAGLGLGSTLPEVLPPTEIHNPVLENEAILPPSIDASRSDTDIDWSYSNLMNPFLDLTPPFIAPFDVPSYPLAMPLYFAPEFPLMHFEDDSSNNESPLDNLNGSKLQPDLEGDLKGTSVGSSNSFDGIVLPALDSQEGSGNIGITITQLLTRYDQEFCVTPLTHDFDANPFRVDKETKRGSQLLLHSILALSYRHINRDTGDYALDAKRHKKKALKMLNDMEGGTDISPIEANFLDAVLILMTLDCAISAHGPWNWYLKRAHKMIQATESLNVKKTPRMQARIEMLVWWDVTLSLTSRQGCVLSESTILSLFNRDKGDDATFYSVSGCPEALFRLMVRLGSYAREFELVSDMACAKFDLGPVLEVEKTVREWKDAEYGELLGNCAGYPNSADNAVPNPGCDEAETAHYREDLHHCAEAWRYALLIYILRVFKWQRDQPPPTILQFLARKTLNHVSACRHTSMLQKQLLLPVFLAGCETSDNHLRDAVRFYCNWWTERTRYDMFLTAEGLLQEVWNQGNSHAWWGSVIDSKSRANMGSGESRQYLFG